MAELHGGNVAVTSEADKGSHFIVSLPWHQRHPLLTADVQIPPVLSQLNTSHAISVPGKDLVNQSTTITVAPVKFPLSPLGRIPSVLIADDNDANLSVLSDFLQEWQCRIFIARTGLEAIEKAKKEHPDLIFMDIQMPVMDGLEAIRRIRNEPLIRYIPIVVLTAFATPEYQEDSLAIGADAFLSKPIQFDRLTEVLHTHLGNIVAKDQL
jgi:CheY-like chemotaxis protein